MLVSLAFTLAACEGGVAGDTSAEQAADAPVAPVAPVASQAPAVPVYDPDVFELAGVRLGMTSDQAQQGLARFYSANPDDIKIKAVRSPMPITNHQNAVYSVVYESKEEKVQVRLTPSLSRQDTGYMVVSGVRVVLNNDAVENPNQWAPQRYKTAAERYGPATWSYGLERERFGRADWCAKHDGQGSKPQCVKGTVHFSIDRKGVRLSDTEYSWVWMNELKKWASESEEAGSMKYRSRVNNITTRACRLYKGDELFDCKIGKDNGDTVEILNTTSGSRFDAFERSRVFRVMEVNQVEVGDKIGITTKTRVTKGKQKFFDVRTVGSFGFCELAEKKATTVTLKCKNGIFDVASDWVVGLKEF